MYKIIVYQKGTKTRPQSCGYLWDSRVETHGKERGRFLLKIEKDRGALFDDFDKAVKICNFCLKPRHFVDGVEIVSEDKLLPYWGFYKTKHAEEVIQLFKWEQ